MKGKAILCVSAHPDDFEFCCGGSIAKWTGEGANVYLLVLTDGSKGSEDLSISSSDLTKNRKEEQLQAAKILGVKKVFFLDFVDGELENSLEVKKEIVKFIRKLKPDIVLTMDPQFLYSESYGYINHADHRAAGQATLDSVYPFSRNSRTFPELLEEGLKPHKVSEVYLINFKENNFYVDIEKTLDKKIAGLSAHKNQGVGSEKVIDVIKKMAEDCGKACDCKYAEGFLRIQIKA